MSKLKFKRNNFTLNNNHKGKESTAHSSNPYNKKEISNMSGLFSATDVYRNDYITNEIGKDSKNATMKDLNNILSNNNNIIKNEDRDAGKLKSPLS